ncbi:MAG: hypothetical protein U0359_22970 [Byssovorax sp.]
MSWSRALSARCLLALAGSFMACGGSPGMPSRAGELPPAVEIAAEAPAPSIEEAPGCPNEPPELTEPRAGSRLPPLPKINPAVMKAYRVEVCYWGTLELEAARDSYLRSLHGAAPSEAAIPVFPRHPENQRPSYERQARACNVAVGLADPATPVDAAMADFAPFSVALAQDITRALAYYERGEHLQDGFAEGNALHARLIEGFGKLDALRGRLGAAMPIYERQRPAPSCAKEASERRTLECFATARVTLRGLLAAQPSPAGPRPSLDALERCSAAVKDLSSASPSQPWPKILAPLLEAFTRKAADARFDEEGLDPESKQALAEGFVSLIEARMRATTRAMVVSVQNIQGGPPAAPP